MALSAVDRLHYVFGKFTESGAQCSLYFEVLDGALRDRELASVAVQTLPHPDQLSGPALERLSALHAQYKLAHTQSAGVRYFRDLRIKLFKKHSLAMREAKESARRLHRLQVGLHQFVVEGATRLQEAKALLADVQATLKRLQARLNKEDVATLTA